MTAIAIQFILNYDDHREIEDLVLYAIRREIAMMFENAEFGRAVEENDGVGRFTNTFLRPTIDDYSTQDHDLVILYQTSINPAQGNLAFLLLQGIPTLHDFVHAQYHIEIITRVVYN